MSFGTPLLLLALLVVPVAVALYVRHDRARERGRSRFAAPALLPSVAPHRPGGRRHVAPALYAVALALLIVAVARPQRSTAVPVEQATVELVIDRSGSMRAQDVKPDRLDAVKTSALRFLDRVPDKIRVGGISFNQKVQQLAPPDTDRTRVREAVQGLTARGGTAAGDALTAALAAIRSARQGDRSTPAAIVLLSDGKSVRGTNPVEVARTAKRENVRIYTLALGTDQGTLTSRRANGTIKTEIVPPDPATLKQVAQITGGTATEATNAAALDQAYEDLGSKVAQKRGKQELTAAWAGGAFVLILAGAGVALGLNGRIL